MLSTVEISCQADVSGTVGIKASTGKIALSGMFAKNLALISDTGDILPGITSSSRTNQEPAIYGQKIPPMLHVTRIEGI